LVVIVAALPLLGLQRAGAGWDARSIWLLHARWVLGGGSALAHGLGSRVFVFSHPDYPPLVPAVVGSLWRVTGEADLRVGQIAVTELNVCAVALTGLAFVRLLEGRLRFVAALFGGGVCLAAYGFAGVYTVAA